MFSTFEKYKKSFAITILQDILIIKKWASESLKKFFVLSGLH
jgi:hypothetical protein